MKLLSKLIFGAALTAGLIGCNGKETVKIIGAGASFPNPLYTKMFYNYHKQKNIEVNYQSIGSGGGVKQISARAVDFGASDAFLNDEKLAKIEKPILHIPTCLGAVAVTYNLKGIQDIKLTPEVLTGIFMGKITQWNDAAISALNSGVALPDKGIQVVHRSDGSGTTAIFTDYLAKVSPIWKEKVGKGKSVKWPTGLGAKGNEGVSGLIKKVEGSIGYVELAYTIQTKMPVALIKNSSGNFIEPSLESTSLAGEGEIPADTRISLTNTSAENGYPIGGFTWLLIYKEQNYDGRTKAQAKALVDLVDWMIHEGQQYTKPLHYAPLPEKALVQAEKILKSITYNGKSLM